MFLFIDESGDCGVAEGRASAPHFTLAAACFETQAKVETCAGAIKRLRIELGLPASHEFHFKGADETRRRAFLSAIAHQDFSYVAVTLNKARLNSKRWRVKSFFYGQVGARLVSLLQPLVIDGVGQGRGVVQGAPTLDHHDDREYVGALRDQFKRAKAADGRSLFKALRTSDSRNSDPIQMADMVCGTLVRAYHRGDESYREIIKGREVKWEVWAG